MSTNKSIWRVLKYFFQTKKGGKNSDFYYSPSKVFLHFSLFTFFPAQLFPALANLKCKQTFMVFSIFRHSTLRSTRMDQIRKVPSGQLDSLEPRYPPLRHGLWRHSLRNRQPNQKSPSSLQTLSPTQRRGQGPHQAVLNHLNQWQNQLGRNLQPLMASKSSQSYQTSPGQIYQFTYGHPSP